jgi:hypothetical protein
MQIHSPSSGPLLLTPFSRNSPDFVSEFPGHNTRESGRSRVNAGLGSDRARVSWTQSKNYWAARPASRRQVFFNQASGPNSSPVSADHSATSLRLTVHSIPSYLVHEGAGVVNVLKFTWPLRLSLACAFDPCVCRLQQASESPMVRDGIEGH